MGDGQEGLFQLSFNGLLKIDFQRLRATPDGGLILIRELDGRLDFGDLLPDKLDCSNGSSSCILNGCLDAQAEIPASRSRAMKLREFYPVRRILAAVVLAVGIMAIPFDALAGPIDVTFYATPEFSDLLLNFSVTNNIGAGVEIWSFGVSISSGQDIPSFGIPPGWADAGPGIPYNNNWTTDTTGPYTILFGETLSGFIARDSDWSPPSGDFSTLLFPGWLTDGPDTIDWIALTIDDAGKGGSMTGTAINVAPVPEPSSLMLLCVGLGMLAVTGLRRPCGHR